MSRDLARLSGEASIEALDRCGHRHEVLVDGRVMRWRLFGEGSPLVLLHGGHGSWLHWARNIDALAARHAVWVPDMPGYGESESLDGSTLDSLVAGILAAATRLLGNATPVTLAGFSFGGLVAAGLAGRWPAVSRLVLMGPAGHGGARRPRGELLSWRSAADRGDLHALASVMRHNLLVHMLHSEDAVDALALHVHTRACLLTRFHSKAISRAGGLFPAVERFQGPVLMIWGEHDVTAVPEQVVAAFCRLQTRGDAAIVPGAGHWVQFESADAVNSVLLAWLTRTH